MVVQSHAIVNYKLAYHFTNLTKCVISEWRSNSSRGNRVSTAALRNTEAISDVVHKLHSDLINSKLQSKCSIPSDSAFLEKPKTLQKWAFQQPAA